MKIPNPDCERSVASQVASVERKSWSVQSALAMSAPVFAIVQLRVTGAPPICPVDGPVNAVTSRFTAGPVTVIGLATEVLFVSLVCGCSVNSSGR